MKMHGLIGLAALLAGGLAQAQDVKVNVLLEAWYTQMLDSNLRLNGPAVGGYMAAPSNDSVFKENQFSIRRCEITLGGKLTDQLTWNVMFDPNLSTSQVGNNVLQDAWVNYQFTPQLSVRGGQFKPMQTWEAAVVAPSGIMFYNRSMVARLVGDRRDRGVVAVYAFGAAQGLYGKMNLGVFNGTADDGSGGKNPDSSPQKDLASRLELGYGSDHKFGAYYRVGSSEVKDNGTLVAGTTTGWGPNAPTAAEIRANNDKCSNLGAYYVYETSRWQAAVEVITGTLGRRYPTVFSSATPVKREHLDQKFLGYTFSGVYKMSHHQLTARYDFLNYNQGNDWYTPTSPYLPTTGVNAGSDFSPKFTEAILGYNYVFNPAKFSQGKVKLNYIHRSKNILAPRLGQTGEQGGDSLLLSLQVGY